MIGALLGLIFLVIILGFLWWAGQQLLPLIPVAEPFRTILRILIALLILIVVLYVFMVLLSMAGVPVANFGFYPHRY